MYWNSMEGLIFCSILLFLLLCVTPCIVCGTTRRFLKTKLLFIDYDTPIVSEISKIPQATATPKRALGVLATVFVILLSIFAVPYFITNYELSNTTITATTDDGANMNGYLKFQVDLYSETDYSCNDVQVTCDGDLTLNCADEDDLQISGSCFTQILWENSNGVHQTLAISIPVQGRSDAVQWAMESYICGTCGNSDCCQSVAKEPISDLRTFQDQVLCSDSWASVPSTLTVSLTPQAMCEYDNIFQKYAEIKKTTFAMEVSQQTSESGFSLLVVVPAFSTISTCFMEDSDLIDLVLRIVSFLGSMLGIRTMVRQIFVYCWDCGKKYSNATRSKVPFELEEEEEELLMSTNHS